MNGRALKSSVRPADAVSGPVTRSDDTKPSATNLGGISGASLRTQCASDGAVMRYWCPSWAVMGPAMPGSEDHAADLEHATNQETP